MWRSTDLEESAPGLQIFLFSALRSLSPLSHSLRLCGLLYSPPVRRPRPTASLRRNNGGIRRKVRPAAREATRVSHLPSRPKGAHADTVRSPFLFRLHSESAPVSQPAGPFCMSVYRLCGIVVLTKGCVGFLALKIRRLFATVTGRCLRGPFLVPLSLFPCP